MGSAASSTKPVSYCLWLENVSADHYWAVGEHGPRTVPAYKSETAYEQILPVVRNFLFEIKKVTPRAKNFATGSQLTRLLESLHQPTETIKYVTAHHPAYDLWLTWPWKISNGGLVEPLDIELGQQAKKYFDELIESKQKEKSELDSIV